MFDERIRQFNDLPLEDRDRLKTDIVCTIIGAIFGLTMFILALSLMSYDHYKQTNFPTDSDLVPCSYGLNQNYNLLYFPDILDITTRVCVSVCPNGDGNPLLCRNNSKVPQCDITQTYPSEVNFGRLGGFCAPLDQASQTLLIKTANLSKKWDFLNIYDCIRIGLLVALAMGFFWVFVVQCMPRLVATVTTLLAIFTLIAMGVIVLMGQISSMSPLVKFVLGFVLIGMGVMFAFFLCFYQRRNRLIGIFMDWSTRYLRQNCVHSLYTFFFIALTAGLIFLCLFQHLAFLSNSQPQQQAGDIYLKLSPNIPLFILNIFQFIWGLQFLKDTFNFVLSGLATQWYTEHDCSFWLTFLRLLKYHFGSVVGGSFLNAFFNVFNFMLQSVRCYRDGACPLFASCYDAVCGCKRNFFQLVRTDVYSYINLTGIPYCDAARNCENLIQNFHLFVGCQSVLYFYRISAYCFTVGVTLITTYAIQFQKLAKVDFISLIFAGVLSYCMLNFFVDLHANIAEGVQISYLIQVTFGSKDQTKPGVVIGNDRFGYKYEIESMKKSYKDGQFC